MLSGSKAYDMGQCVPSSSVAGLVPISPLVSRSIMLPCTPVSMARRVYLLRSMCVWNRKPSCLALVLSRLV